jgi:hypothetical protein
LQFCKQTQIGKHHLQPGEKRALQNIKKEVHQKTHVKMLTIPGHKGNANQNHTKIPPHFC